MIYAVSDIHGCYKLYQKLLDKIHFSDKDLLYVLGDVIDRGPEPIKVLMDMAQRFNVIPLIGNHEYMAMSVLKKLMMEITDDNYDKVLSSDFMTEYHYWIGDGGQTTLDQFKRLSADDRVLIMDYLEEFELYAELTVNGENYRLVHADIAGEAKDWPLEAFGPAELIFTRADYARVYSTDYVLVTGHTPTMLIDPAYAGKIYQNNRHIAIDCGCVYGQTLGAYCFDTGECVYVK